MRHWTMLAGAIVALTMGGAAAAQTWKFEKKTDAMTDAVSGHAMLFQEGSVFAFTCSAADKPLMVVVLAPRYLGPRSGLEPRLVEYRIDDAERIEARWNYMDHTSTISGPTARALAQSVAGSKKIRFRLRAYDGSIQDLAFPTVGAAEPIRQVLEFCRG